MDLKPIAIFVINRVHSYLSSLSLINGAIKLMEMEFKRRIDFPGMKKQ